MRTLISDLRYTFRTLAGTPGFTVVAVLVLALGIGLNTAVFTLVNMVLLRPLAGDARGEVVGLYSYDTTRPDNYRDFSYPNYADIRDRNEVFSELAAHTLALVGIGEGDLTRRVFAGLVTSNYFATFGVQPVLGRTFTPDEELPGAARPVVIVSHDYWKRNGADPSIAGSTIRINSLPFTVIGVGPRGFGGTTTLISPDVWLPTGMYEIVSNDLFRQGPHTLLSDRANHALMVFGRLRPGTSLVAADPMIRVLGGQIEKAYPGENKDHGLLLHPLSRTSISTNPQEDNEAAGAFGLLMALAAIVLLIACMNLANMLLARGSARRREVAIRLALGANRWHVVRQLLTEGLVLSLAGGAVGLVLAYWSLALFRSSMGTMLPLVLTLDPSPDVRVLAATFGMSVVSTLAFALGPAWNLARTDVITEMKEGERMGAAARRPRLRFRQLLVVSQVALSLALLTTAGLAARGAFKASKAEPGFSFDGAVLAELDPSLTGYDETRGRELYRRIIERVRALPGAANAALASTVPFGDFTEGRRVARPGGGSDEAGSSSEGTISYGGGAPAATPTGREGVGASYYIVSSGYFETLGIPILRGRGFNAVEDQPASGPLVAVIDEPLARRLFPDEEPLGQHIRFPGREASDLRTLEVVGIAGATRHSLFDQEPQPHVYVPTGQQYRGNMHLHVRAAGSGRQAEAALLAAIRQEIRAVDDRVPILGLKTMRQHRDESMGAWIVNAGARLFTVFGALAMFLAVIGVYGVRAYLVSRRTRELGVRMALGATQGDVMWLVLSEGIVLVAAGLGVGFLLSLGVGRVVSGMLYQVGAFDVGVFVLTPIVLAAAALVACYFPARRAMRVTPVVALRTE
jgi:predicted permease